MDVVNLLVSILVGMVVLAISALLMWNFIQYIFKLIWLWKSSRKK